MIVISETTVKSYQFSTFHDAFFTGIIRYAVLSDHNTGALYSPDLSDVLLGNRLHSCTEKFVGRKEELKEISDLLSRESHVFVTGIAGIGKSELAKAYAHKNKKKYTNIIYMYYTGDLRRDIAGLVFADDKAEATQEDLFAAHYRTIQTLHFDSLLIIDNFNVLPKEEPFLKELLKNDVQILITSRCKITAYNHVEIKELNRDKELQQLFYDYCPASKNEKDTVLAIIDTLQSHTLTVCMAALTLQASGMEPEELLQELKTSCVRQNTDEIEVYKDEEFAYATMIGHLQRLMQICNLSEVQKSVLRNLSLLPTSGIPKVAFGKWTQLPNQRIYYNRLLVGTCYYDKGKYRIFRVLKCTIYG